jgi:hypothetical protein
MENRRRECGRVGGTDNRYKMKTQKLQQQQQQKIGTHAKIQRYTK